MPPDVYLYPGESQPADVRLTDPTVLAGGGADGLVNAVVATLAIGTLAPAIAADANVTAVVATATWASSVPAVSAEGNVTAVVAAETWAAAAPAAAADAQITAVAAGLSVAGVAPAVSADASVAAFVSAVTIGAVAPAVSGDAEVQAVTAAQAFAAIAPAVSPLSAEVLAPVAVLAIAALAPTIGEPVEEPVSLGGGGFISHHRLRSAESQETRHANVAAVAARATWSAIAPAVSADSNVVAFVARERIEAHAPQASGQIIHVLAPQRFSLVMFTLEEVDGHFVVKRAVPNEPATDEESEDAPIAAAK
jgi:hypothetical protein